MKTLFSNKWIAGIGTTVIAGVILYFFLPSTGGIHNNENVNGSIQTIGQTGGTNIINSDGPLKEQLKYLSVSKLNAFGSAFDQASTSAIIFNSPLSTSLAPFLSTSNNVLTWQCSTEAMMTYRKIIVEMPEFPFAHFYLGSCEKGTGSLDWESEIAAAKKIFEITTTIPDHHVNHDDVLKIIRDKYSN